MTIRVVVVDDQQLVRTGFAALLGMEDDIEVVGEAADGAEALEVCRRTAPDVVVMDIRMPVMDGVQATRALMRDAGPRPAVLVLTTFDLDELVHTALSAGASGFLLKDARPEALASAVRVVAQGDAMLAPSVTRRLLSHFAAGLADESSSSGPAWEAARALVSTLTDREVDVLRLMALGRSNGEIAADMVVAETTVKTHVGRIFMKLRARDRVQAVIVAYRAGVVHPSDG